MVYTLFLTMTTNINTYFLTVTVSVKSWVFFLLKDFVPSWELEAVDFNGPFPQ